MFPFAVLIGYISAVKHVFMPPYKDKDKVKSWYRAVKATGRLEGLWNSADGYDKHLCYYYRFYSFIGGCIIKKNKWIILMKQNKWDGIAVTGDGSKYCNNLIPPAFDKMFKCNSDNQLDMLLIFNILMI